MNDSDDEVLMPEIIENENFEPEPMESLEDDDDEMTNFQDEVKEDIKNEDIFTQDKEESIVPKIQPIKKVNEEVNNETEEENENFIYESDDEKKEEPKEFENGYVRSDGKVWYNGKWKSQKQLEHLKKMREKRWKDKPKKSESKPIIDESMIEQIALKTITEYKKQRRAKKQRIKDEEEDKARHVVIKEEKNEEKIIEKPKLVRQVSRPQNNVIHNTIYTPEESQYADCF